ncbi:hypothetical protein CRG98_002913 [Punica granatum]|uniref:Uncharacterized protein n=1 Tax=Punica granatum TaxID=22663 RepID=A0A2I0L7C3_PUNGR|nr:hypothetical protein CRG98_002913 [Punica granatum]
MSLKMLDWENPIDPNSLDCEKVRVGIFLPLGRILPFSSGMIDPIFQSIPAILGFMNHGTIVNRGLGSGKEEPPPTLKSKLRGRVRGRERAKRGEKELTRSPQESGYYRERYEAKLELLERAWAHHGPVGRSQVEARSILFESRVETRRGPMGGGGLTKPPMLWRASRTFHGGRKAHRAPHVIEGSPRVEGSPRGGRFVEPPHGSSVSPFFRVCFYAWGAC